MTDNELGADRADRLAREALTYPEVGRTRAELPGGYHHVTREGLLGHGPERFDEAARALFGWELQRRAGVRVLPSTPTVTDGADAVLLLGLGPVAIQAPVRVVYVIVEPDRAGFAYGTLRGHPESGEEAFMVELRPDGAVVCRVTAFSKPATWPARLGGPFARATQSWVTGRYVRSLRT